MAFLKNGALVVVLALAVTACGKKKETAQPPAVVPPSVQKPGEGKGVGNATGPKAEAKGYGTSTAAANAAVGTAISATGTGLGILANPIQALANLEQRLYEFQRNHAMAQLGRDMDRDRRVSAENIRLFHQRAKEYVDAVTAATRQVGQTVTPTVFGITNPFVKAERNLEAPLKRLAEASEMVTSFLNQNLMSVVDGTQAVQLASLLFVATDKIQKHSDAFGRAAGNPRGQAAIIAAIIADINAVTNRLEH